MSDNREIARGLLAPHFATDGEEEDARIAEAVAALLESIPAALDAATERGRMQGWRPIAEAPRDGTPIDLWAVSYLWNADGNRQAAVMFRVPAATWFGDEWTDEDGNPHPALEGFTELEFTHFQPLPEPPVALDAATERGRMQGWRPIADAPMQEKVLLGYYNGPLWHAFVSTRAAYPYASHWQPLPTPPAPEGE